MDDSNQIVILGADAKIPLEMQLDAVYYHNLGVLPLVEFRNLPVYNYFGEHNNYAELKDDAGCQNLAYVVNHIIEHL